MTKTAQEILSEWADPETGGTMPREVREAALGMLAALESIAKNTCCEPCQEAARVAATALQATRP